ncbi:hypothetical protein DL764_002518 [Monosporascus ibericus]|uniref:Aminoglycoside phosphotransferase domain-containing protein n=1 Tax=Monosporascus ibericus TaxID=155417 RepID=A0A4Q4TPP7_9PEZI|nr:hypothetical protein DL764_002518 [Monosporascus ibericus]
MAGAVRHPIDVKALERYISEHVPEIEVPLDVKQFGFGQSNPTYQLTSSATGRRYVLRKKPPGKLLSKAAHKVEREHRVIAALHAGRTGVPVPRPYCLCEDPAVLGTPFYIMEFVGGRIIEDPLMRREAKSPAERAALWKAAVETLARLHAVDVAAVGLGSFGGGGGRGFYARQLETWRRICEAQARTVDADTGSAVGHVPHFEELLAFFGDPRAPGRPRDDRVALVHGDYKIDNLVFHATEPRVVGILDWEMSTLGHPLSDLANLLHPVYGTGPGVVVASPSPSPSSRPAAAAAEGLPDPETAVSWYRDAAGWDPAPEMAWALAFSVFRLSAICQGIAARVATRQASSESARRHAEAMGPLAETAWAMVQKAKADAAPENKEDEEENGTTREKRLAAGAKL